MGGMQFWGAAGATWGYLWGHLGLLGPRPTTGNPEIQEILVPWGTHDAMGYHGTPWAQQGSRFPTLAGIMECCSGFQTLTGAGTVELTRASLRPWCNC